MKRPIQLFSLLLSATLVFGLTACTNNPRGAVTSVTLNETALTIPITGTERLSVTIAPADATNRNITWTSSNPAVATVAANGVITTLSTGTTTITVTSECGAHTASCTVTVVEIPAISASLDGVVIAGIRWATRNVYTPGVFAESPTVAGAFYQWNRRKNWADTGAITGWDGTFPAEAEWEAHTNPCPEGWRVPTRQELQTLNDLGSVWITYNGVAGRLFGSAPNYIFLPAVGFRSTSGAFAGIGYVGDFWSSEQDTAEHAWTLWISSGGSDVVSNPKANGSSVRCVI